MTTLKQVEARIAVIAKDKDSDEWWDSLSLKAQKQYIKEHPRSMRARIGHIGSGPYEHQDRGPDYRAHGKRAVVHPGDHDYFADQLPEDYSKEFRQLPKSAQNQMILKQKREGIKFKYAFEALAPKRKSKKKVDTWDF